MRWWGILLERHSIVGNLQVKKVRVENSGVCDDFECVWKLRVLGSLTSEVENECVRWGGWGGKHLLSDGGQPALMHFNESVLYTAGHVEGFMGIQDEALNCIIFRCWPSQSQSN